jgi:hypothetical protein
MGETQMSAYRKAFRHRSFTDSQISDKAYKMAKSDRVTAVRETVLKELKQSDLDSVGATMVDLLRFIRQAEEAANFTAVAALMRLRMQANAMLSDTIVLKAEEQLTDAELVKRLSGRDTSLATSLKGVLGKQDAFSKAA